jgi:GT2 family glycosyltransferase
MGEKQGLAHPRVAVVVLSWNGREDVLECLASLQHMRYEHLTTIVVDNGSTDGTSEAVRERFPTVELLRSEQNLGFAEGNNLGLRRALELGADFAFVLNNDTELHPDVIAELVAEADRQPRAGALCPLVYYAEPRDLIWYAGGDWDPDRSYNGTMAGYGEPDRGQYREVREVGRATGAAMLVPRDVLEEVGLFDAELYLHVEDVEWSLRMRRAGRSIYLVPSAVLWHKVSRGTGGEASPTIAYYGLRNELAVCDRYATRTGTRAALRRVTTLAVHIVHVRKARRRLANLRAVLAGWRDYRRGRFGPRGGAH